VNTGALVSRMNLAYRLAAGQLRGTAIDCTLQNANCKLENTEEVVSRLLGGDVSDTTRATIAKATDATKMMALTLGAPEFQRR